jgi:hypothetical protein
MAMQAVPEVHARPTRAFSAALLVFAVVWIFHDVPFQTSARVRLALNEVLKYVPTAVQALPERQTIPERKLSKEPLGLGVDWVVQLVPFQASAKVRSVPEPFW